MEVVVGREKVSSLLIVYFLLKMERLLGNCPWKTMIFD